MKLSELFAALKDCQTDPELRVAFMNRPGHGYELAAVDFRAEIETGTLAEFNKQVGALNGPKQIVLIALAPDYRGAAQAAGVKKS